MAARNCPSLTPTTDLQEVPLVRGLFDTDGCIYRKYGPYMQIQFKLANPDLLTYVKECPARRGFHPTSVKRDDTKLTFYLSRQIEINRFFEVIEPKNIKHLKRFYDVPRQQSFRSYTHHPKTFEKSGPDQAL